MYWNTNLIVHFSHSHLAGSACPPHRRGCAPGCWAIWHQPARTPREPRWTLLPWKPGADPFPLDRSLGTDDSGQRYNETHADVAERTESHCLHYLYTSSFVSLPHWLGTLKNALFVTPCFHMIYGIYAVNRLLMSLPSTVQQPSGGGPWRYGSGGLLVSESSSSFISSMELDDLHFTSTWLDRSDLMLRSILGLISGWQNQKQVCCCYTYLYAHLHMSQSISYGTLHIKKKQYASRNKKILLSDDIFYLLVAKIYY